MSIDYREYFAGSCFGAMALSDEAYSAELFGDDLDIELDEEIDQELFGASLTSTGAAFLANVKMYKKLCMMARRQNARCKKFKREKKTKMLVICKRRLAKTKNKMIKGRRRLVAQWKKLDNKWKKGWSKKNKISFVGFLRKYGPHQFQ